MSVSDPRSSRFRSTRSIVLAIGCALTLAASLAVGGAVAPQKPEKQKKASKSEKDDGDDKKNGKKAKLKGGERGLGAAAPAAAPAAPAIVPRSFGETNRGVEYNASGVIPLGDGRFLFCDNNSSDALFELRLDGSGAKTGPLIRRPLAGVAASAGEDLEGLTIVEADGARFAVATSSLSVRKKGGVSGGLLRIELSESGPLQAQSVPNFRDWLISNYPQLKSAAGAIPDAGGLNIEAVAWDASRSALVFGVRTPLSGGRPMVVRVKLNGGATWSRESFTPLPAVALQVEPSADPQGVRSIEWDPSRNAFLVVVANATSASEAPFHVYVWDGNDAGTVHRLPKMWFPPKVKAEGVAHGKVGGRGAIVVVDDAGGYQVVWDDDPRVAS